MSLPILTSIKDGQPYVDEPNYSNPKLLGKIIRSTFGLNQLPSIITSYNHVTLRWMRSDGNGGLIPR